MGELIRFFKMSWLSFKSAYGFMDVKTYLILKVINPLVQLTFFCLIAKYIHKTNNLTYIVIGNSLLLCMGSSIAEMSISLLRERAYGTIRTFVTCSYHKIANLLQRVVVHMFDSILTVLLGLIIGVLVFDVSIKYNSIPLIMLVFLIGILSCSCFGLCIASFGLITGEINMIINIVMMLLLGLSGANFPISILPDWIQKLSYCLPLTRSIQAANILSAGGAQIWHLVIGELIVGASYFTISWILINITEKIAKDKALLDIY